MLEKIGLPAKPSMRGGSWVVDASHCQGCSSQFTFINRKHHCRRCGGLFCNSCTQQRMVLRGQGDSPVRICDPCKKMEEAARFELRYGHKSRAAKGNLKHALKHEEEILGQILGTDGKQHLSSGQESHADAISDHQKFGSSASCSSLNESATPLGEVGVIRSTSVEMHNAAHADVVFGSPEELRQQAVEEKKKYKILKAEGKSEEALQAFKHGKELERQAGALEIAIRKSRRMASKASNLSSTAGTQNTVESEELGSKRKLPSQRNKKEKDDVAAELRELGWSDADVHDADKKSVKLSLEGELSNLLGEITPKSSQGRKTGGIHKSQITAHKKKALLLKREGKLPEAKEELKKAKILEKQLEEQELLGEDEDSDDELSALIRSMGDDKQDDLLLDHAPEPDRNFNHFLGVTDDLAVDGNFEVTDDDMNDPELAAALKSFGWSEEDDQATNHVMQSVSVDREALQSQVLALKREALSQKRAGNTAEAMELLKKAKLLERDLESMQSDAEIFTPELKQETSTTQVSVDPSVAGTSVEESITGISNSFVRSPPKSKLAIQKELLALKKKALTLRREGRLNEAEEELKKGQILEQQLEGMENAPKIPVAKVGKKTLESTHTHEGASVTVGLGEEGLDAEVTEQDMRDPALLSVLKNLGWNDDDVESVSMTNKPTEQMNDESAHDVPSVIPRKAMRSKAETQRDLLALKRKALALRRQGKTEEAEEMLEKAKALENEMAEMENLHNVNSMQVESHVLRSLETQKRSDNQKGTGDVQNTDADLSSVMNNMPKDKVVLTRDAYDVDLKKMSEARKPLPPGSGGKVPETSRHELQKFGKPGLLAAESSIDQPSDLLDFLSGNEEKISRPASGESAWKETPESNNSYLASVPIEPQIQINAKETVGETEILSHGGSTLHMAQKKEINVATTNNSLAPEERLDHGTDVLKDEILARKRRALALKREGKLAEAREELRQAKILEKSLEDGQQSNVGSASVLAPTSNTTSVMQESKTNQSKKPISGRDRLKIQQESLSHKRNALKLRREGKIEESEAELELAKALESQLEELDSQRSSTSTSAGKSEAMGDALVEDLLDPQLMSALKSIGWQDTDFGVQPSRKSESKPKVEQDRSPQAEKAYLEEQIKAEKLRALNFKRAGKQPEALEALRSAKLFEKKLALIT